MIERVRCPRGIFLDCYGKFHGAKNKIIGHQPSLTNFMPVQKFANDLIAIGAQANKTAVRRGTEAVFLLLEPWNLP